MKRLLFCLYVLTLSVASQATGQTGDVIIIDGQRWELLGHPVDADSALYHRLKASLPKERSCSTANWDGYRAYWSIREQQLCLDSIRVKLLNKDTQQYRQECIPLTETFKEYYVGKDIVATWLTDTVRVASGEIIYYEHLGFNRNYEHEQLITIDRGKVIDMKAIENRVVVEGFPFGNEDKKNAAIIANLNLHIEKYPELEKAAKRVGFTVKGIRLDSSGRLIDCHVQAHVYYSDKWETHSGLAAEMAEALKTIYPWKTLFINGEYLPASGTAWTFAYRMK